MQSKTFSNWSGGIDNLAPPGRVPDGFVREAVNVDPTPGGELHLRTGYEQVFAGADVRGVLALNHLLLIAAGTELVEFNTRSKATRVLRTIAGAGQFIGDVLDNVLYFCTGNEALEYDGERVRPWGVPDVTQQPLPTVVSGALRAGTYRLAVTFSDADGREGGTDAPLVLVLGADSGLQVVLPKPPAACVTNLYVSAADGETLYHQYAGQGGTVLLTALRDDTQRLATAYMQAPPVGTVVRRHDTVLAVASGRYVWVTTPMRPYLVDRRRGFFQYAADVNALLSDGDLFVSADKCYAISSVVADAPGQRVALEFPVVRGTEVRLPDGRMGCMTQYGQAFTTRGALGTSQLDLVTRPHHVPARSDAGAAVALDHNGNQLIITAMRGPQGANPLAASDFFIGEVVRP